MIVLATVEVWCHAEQAIHFNGAVDIGFRTTGARGLRPKRFQRSGMVAYWDTHGCDWNFVLHADEIHDTRSSQWSNRGYYEACNIDKEFAKFWNASHLMHFGLQDSYDSSFHHSTADYVELTVKYDTNFHDDLHQTATDDMSYAGQFSWQMWHSNEVRTSCHVYNATYAWANPAARGGVSLW